MKQTIINISLVAVFALLVGFGQSVLAQTPWTAPNSSFPQGNVNPPIHEGQVYQSKTTGAGSGLAGIPAYGFEADYVLGLNGIFADRNYARKFCLTSSGSTGMFLDTGDCIDDWDDLGGETNTTIVEGIDPGNENETLRFDGSDWVSNNVLQNDGVTVTVKRGGGLPSIDPGDGGFIGPGGGFDGGDLPGGGGGSTGGSTGGQGTTPPPSTGFLDNLFSPKKAYAQNGSSSAPIFRAIKDVTNFQGNTVIGHKGLEVLAHGITWTKGGLVSEGDLTVTGDTILKDYTEVHRLKILDQGTENTDGGILEAWDGSFYWNGGSGWFNVGTSARFTGNLEVSGPLKISSGGPAEGRVLTSDAQGNTIWSDVSASAPSVIKVNGNSIDHNSGAETSEAECPSSHPILVGGGGSCSRNLAHLNDSYPSGNKWKATCGTPNLHDNTTIAYALCMTDSISLNIQASNYTPPPAPLPWHGYTLNAGVNGNDGQSCLDYINSQNIPGWPTITNPANVGMGGNPNSFNAPINPGECSYVVMGDPQSYALSSAGQAPSPNHRPFSVGQTSVWARY